MGHVGRGLHFLVAKGLEAGYVLVAARGAVHFYPVGASSELLPGCSLHAFYAIALACIGNGANFIGRAGDVQAVGGHKHAWPRQSAPVDEVAQGDVDVVK